MLPLKNVNVWWRIWISVLRTQKQYLSPHVRLWYLPQMWTINAQGRLSIRAVRPELLLHCMHKCTIRRTGSVISSWNCSFNTCLFKYRIEWITISEIIEPFTYRLSIYIHVKQVYMWMLPIHHARVQGKKTHLVINHLWVSHLTCIERMAVLSDDAPFCLYFIVHLDYTLSFYRKM